ncbi:hypothetical protein ACFL3G_07270 [Planctomycetota bacterium]
MKSEHRHELKTNELAEWLVHFPQWLKDNQRTIIYVAVILVITVAAYIWKNYKTNVVHVREKQDFTNLVTRLSQSKIQILQSQEQGYDTSINLLQIADNLQAVANKSKNKLMAALALIKRAEILRMELHYRYGSVAEQDIAIPTDKAMASYTKALKLLSADKLEAPVTEAGDIKSLPLAAAAKLGLGLCQEEKGNFPEAKKLYRLLSDSPVFAGTIAAVTASRRLKVMADYQQKVAFRPAKKSQIQPTQPEIRFNLPELTPPQTPETNSPNN